MDNFYLAYSKAILFTKMDKWKVNRLIKIVIDKEKFLLFSLQSDKIILWLCFYSKNLKNEPSTERDICL